MEKKKEKKEAGKGGKRDGEKKGKRKKNPRTCRRRKSGRVSEIHTVLFEGDVNFASQGVEKQCRLAPRCVDLAPLHLDVGEAAQAEAIDCAKVTVVPENAMKRSTRSVGRQTGRGAVVLVKPHNH